MKINVKNRVCRNCPPHVVAGKIGTKTHFPPGKIGTKTNLPPEATGKIGTKTNFPQNSAIINTGKIGTKTHFPPGKIGTKTHFPPDADFPQNSATINAGKIGTKETSRKILNTNLPQNLATHNKSFSTIYTIKYQTNEVTMTDKEDDRIKSNKTWIKWNQINDGTSMKYGDKMFTKPEQSEQLKNELIRKMKNYDAAKRKKSEDDTPKRARVKYDEAIGKINMNKTWIQWTTLKPGETLRYKSRVFRKDVPDDQEKLMTRIINGKDGYNKEKEKKDLNDKKNASSTLMEWLSMQRGEQSNKLQVHWWI